MVGQELEQINALFTPEQVARLYELRVQFRGVVPVGRHRFWWLSLRGAGNTGVVDHHLDGPVWTLELE